MRRLLCVTTMALSLALAPAAAGAGAASPARAVAHNVGAMGMGTVTVPNVVAGPYKLTLVIGPAERMYTLAEYRRLHPKSGEIMLRGAMMSGGMGMMGTTTRHLELHVMDRRTMRVVPDATVMISYVRTAPMGAMMMPHNVPIAVMQGIGMGMGDIHYGNNVDMPAGPYRVSVRVNRAYATYTVRLM